jgi:hypothetical protein
LNQILWRRPRPRLGCGAKERIPTLLTVPGELINVFIVLIPYSTFEFTSDTALIR